MRGVSRLAMFLNVTQPVALFVGIRCSGLYHEFRHSYAVLVLYAVVLLTQLDEIWPRSASIAPRDGCTHLNLGYWDTSRALVYVTASFLIIAEARPAYWAITNALLFGTTLILAHRGVQLLLLLRLLPSELRLPPLGLALLARDLALHRRELLIRLVRHRRRRCRRLRARLLCRAPLSLEHALLTHRLAL